MLLVLYGCFVPQTVPDAKENENCQLITKKLRFSYSEELTDKIFDSLSTSQARHCNRPECLLAPLAVALAVPVGSAIVSGSIVVTGNSLHWLEKQGACEDSETQKSIKQLLEASKASGGEIIQSYEELVLWLENQLHIETSKTLDDKR